MVSFGGGGRSNLSLPSSPLSPDPRTPKRKRTDACAPTSTVRLSLPPSPDESVSGLDLPEASPLAASVPCVPQTGLHESPADFPFPHTPARTFDDISLTHPLSRCPPACPSGPIRDLSGSSPFRHPINPKITLWWTCDQCNYKIFQHEDLPCPYHKRIRHLSIAHKIKKVDIPPLPEVPTPPPSGKWIAMSQFLCDRIEKQGWNGIHLVNLNPKDDKQRLICTICHETFTTWNKVPSNSCPQNAKGSVKTISGTQKRKLWTTWYTQAQKHAKEYIKQCSKDLIETMFKVNQAANDSRWPAEPPKPLGGLPCIAPEFIPEVWWTCKFCGFKIPNNGSWAKKDGARRYHLKTKHTNASGNIPGNHRGGLNQAPGILASRDAVKRRWARKLEEFRKVLWPGAHDIETDPAVVKVSVNKTSGKTYQNPRYRCRKCGHTFPAGEIPTSVCKDNPGKIPSVKKRKELWKQCYDIAAKAETNCGGRGRPCRTKVAKQTKVSAHQKITLSKRSSGTTSTKRGLRGQRIGEASNPGPRDFLMWSVNCRSWRKHAYAILDEATSNNIQLVALQETNLSKEAQPSASHTCYHAGWQVLFCAPDSNKSTNRGGVALAVKRPFSLKKLHEETSSEGQTLSAVLHGAQRSINVVTHYRHHTDQTMNGIQRLTSNLQICREPSWIVACDANANVIQGPVPEYFQTIGGVNLAVARHVKSQYPIDAVFASADLTRTGNAGVELPPLGADHTRAQAKICVTVPKYGKPMHRFSKFRPVISKDPAKVPWKTVACPPDIWQDKLLNPEEAWQTWAQAVETWLVRAGILDPRRGEKTLGSEPSLRMAPHRLGFFQSLEERQLRRLHRKIEEARFLSLQGRPIPQSLYTKICSSPVLPPQCWSDVEYSAWGKISGILSNKLHDLQEAEKSMRLSDWKDKIHSLAGACKWVQKSEVTPMVLKHNGFVCVSPGKVLDALKTTWSEIFGCNTPLINENDFMNSFRDSLPPSCPPFQLDPISVRDIQKAAQKMKHKAPGPDGFQTEFLLLLPQEAIKQLAELFTAFETSKTWPSTMLHWKLAFLPKPHKDDIPQASQMRPIAVGHVLYRIWSRIRLVQVQHLFTPLLAPFQSGSQGPGCLDLFISWDQEFPPENFGFCAALDYTKCFDSLDYNLPLALFEHCGLPSQITALLRSQWGSHSRWVSLNGCVTPSPLRNAKGIPQGDPWSPLALTLVLGCVSRQQKSQVPAASTLLYLDDRSILAPDLQSLQDAMSCWSRLEQVTRMSTNDSKTQFIARTSEAWHEFQHAGFNVSKAGTILGCTLGISPRPLSQQEHKQKAEVARIAPRISLLPVKLRFRAQVASYTLTSKMSWGALFSGRSPDVTWFQKMFKTAVSGTYKNPRTSVALTKFYLWGHRADLGFVACQNLLKALTRWKALRQDFQWNFNSPMLKALKISLTKLQCQVQDNGIISWPLGSWDLASPPGFCDQFAHNFRVHWRYVQLNQWLSSGRNDALIARNQGLHINSRLIDRLHLQSKKVSGDEIAIMTGGFLTHVHLKQDANVCLLCESSYPDTDHLLWHCPYFRDLRSLPKPSNLLIARLGWCSDIHPVISQMGRIWARAAAANRTAWWAELRLPAPTPC